MTADFRTVIAEYIAQQARPPEKYGHQPRLYALTQAIGAGLEYDDDVVFAAAWLHDLGVFVGHRPEDPVELARWDHVAYVVEKAPGILESAGFAREKIPAVLEAIRTHQPKDEPRTMEALILRDADILEQLGAIGIARTLCKVGRDTRYATFTPAVEVLRRALVELPGHLRLESARRLAAPRVCALRDFLEALDAEVKGALF